MNTITIQVDDEILARASKLAAAKHMTVSSMVERLLHVVAMPRLDQEELPAATRQAVGLLPTMNDEQVEELLDEKRTKKYGL
jgi:predicted transcriptional regulator